LFEFIWLCLEYSSNLLCLNLKRNEKEKKNIIKCLSTTVQIFSKAAQAQLRERAYVYKAVRCDNYHKVVSGLVVRCGTRGGQVTGSTLAGRAIYILLFRSRFRFDGGTKQSALWDLPARSVVGPACLV
jgi:hypothetical protein